jgi:phosphonoacetaldehyde hydrolase
MELSQFDQPLKAVLLDWAGTTVDFGSRAPTRVFVEIFAQRGVNITEAEARGPMGMAKRAHIQTVAALPRVDALWRERYGRSASDEDIDRMYEEFLPLQKSVLASMSEVIPGIPEAIAALRRQGIKIGSTTGYTKELMEIVIPVAAEGGYHPDATVCSDEVSAGRPAPWSNFLAAQRLGVYPLSQVIVVDDTRVGIEAGLNAGAVTVAVSRTGNAMGLSQQEVDDVPADELRARLETYALEFRELGAHGVIESVADLPSWIATRYSAGGLLAPSVMQ